MFDPSYNSAMQQMGFGHTPNCGKCGLAMTPENSRLRPELLLHDECLPDVMITNKRRWKSVAMMVQELLLDKTVENQSKITAAGIAEALERIMTMLPTWEESIDRESIKEEMRRRFCQ